MTEKTLDRGNAMKGSLRRRREGSLYDIFTYKGYFHDPNLPVVILPMRPQPTIPLHTHEFIELVIVQSGEGLHLMEKHAYLVMPGDAFVIPMGVPHGYRNLKDLELVNVLFDPGLLELPWMGADLRIKAGFRALFELEPGFRQKHIFSSRLHLQSHQLARVRAMIREMDTTNREKEPGYVFMAMAHLLRITGYLSRCYGEADSPRSISLLRLAKVFGYLEEHFAEEISLSHIIGMANMSKSTLSRAFRKSVDLSPMAYLNGVRIKQACQLLCDTDFSVTEIANRSGFSDGNYFCRKFHKVMGVTPRKYRLATRI